MSDVPHHDELPLPDYDHLPVGSLESRIRSLGPAEVEQVLAYERAHGDRLPVVTVLQARLRQLSEGAEPTGGDVTEVAPESGAAPPAGSKVGPETSGPPVNPPSHGDPTNPSQPRR